MYGLNFRITGESNDPARGKHVVKVHIEADHRAFVAHDKISESLREFAESLVKEDIKDIVIEGRFFKIKSNLDFIPGDTTGLHPSVDWSFEADEIITKKPKTLNDWVSEVHNLAKEKGWYDGEPRRPAEMHMLMVSEIAEATEEVRNGRPAIYWMTPTGLVSNKDAGDSFNLSVGKNLQKPEGESVELADCMIRIMDYFGKNGWDLEKTIQMKHDYNCTRGHRHGGKAL